MKEEQSPNQRYATVEINGKEKKVFIFHNEEEMIRCKTMLLKIEACLTKRQAIIDRFINSIEYTKNKGIDE